MIFSKNLLKFIENFLKNENENEILLLLVLKILLKMKKIY